MSLEEAKRRLEVGVSKSNTPTSLLLLALIGSQGRKTHFMKTLSIEELSSCIAGVSFHYADQDCKDALENLGWGTIGILAGFGTGVLGALGFVGGLWAFAKGSIGIPNYCIYV